MFVGVGGDGIERLVSAHGKKLRLDAWCMSFNQHHKCNHNVLKHVIVIFSFYFLWVRLGN